MSRHIRSDIQKATNGDSDLYRIRMRWQNNQLLFDALKRTSRPNKSIQRIAPVPLHDDEADYDVILSQEDLTAVMLTLPVVSIKWLSKWIDAKL